MAGTLAGFRSAEDVIGRPHNQLAEDNSRTALLFHGFAVTALVQSRLCAAMPRVTGLYVFPVKSMGGIAADKLYIGATGANTCSKRPLREVLDTCPHLFILANCSFHL